MNLLYLLLPVGIALLAVPTAVICGAKIRERLDQPARRHSEGILPLLRCRFNWLDLFRGAAGAWLVQKPFQDSVSSQDELATTFLVIEIVVLLVGVLAQTLRIRRPVRVIGPVFFLTGLTLVLSGPLTGGFALVLGFSCALIIGRLSTIFALVPAALVGFGFLFHEFGVTTAFNAAAFALPAFLAFTFGTRISFVRRSVEALGHKARSVPAQEPKAEPAPEPKTAMADAVAVEGKSVEDTVIRPDFSNPPTPEPTPVRMPMPARMPAEVRKVAGDSVSVPLPDFLRIAEEPEPPRRVGRKKLFPLRGA